MICQYCNEEIIDKAIFCTKCGKKIVPLVLQENLVEKSKADESGEELLVDQAMKNADETSMDVLIEEMEQETVQETFDQVNEENTCISTCASCGKELIAGSKFCIECGNSVTENNTNYMKSNKIPISVIVMMACVLLAVFAVIGVVLIKGKKHTINVQDYMEVTFDGYNGYGNASVKFDEYAFLLEVLKYSRIKGIDTKELQRIVSRDVYTTYEQFADMQKTVSEKTRRAWNIYEEDIKNAGFEYELDKISELKNGDQVIVSYKFNSDIYEEYGIELAAEPKTYSVVNLPELEEYDAFENYTVVFSGIAPYVTAEIIDQNNSFEYYISPKLDKEMGIKKGDTVTLILEVNQEALAKEMGYYVAETRKEYVCDNVSSYVSKLDEIPPEVMEIMRQHGQDSLNAYIESDWITPSTFEKQTMVGNYLLTPKSRVDFIEPYSFLYFIYKVDVKTEEKKFSFYYYVCYYNIQILPDGTYSVDLTIYDEPNSGETFVEDDLIYRGYKKIGTLKKNCINRMLNVYDCETNIEE